MIFPEGAHQVDLFINSGKLVDFSVPQKTRSKRQINFLNSQAVCSPVISEKEDLSSVEKRLLLKPPRRALLPSFSDFKQRFDRPVISQTLGLVTFIIAFIGISLTIGPVFAAEISYRLRQIRRETTRIVNQEPPKPKRIFVSDLLGEVEFEKIPLPVDTDFGIVIPKLGLNIKVVPNVSLNNPKEYLSALKQGVAHAAGTAFPDKDGVALIFGHSALAPVDIIRFNAVFYQIKDLEVGDEINLFYSGRRYLYKVTEKKVVAPIDTEFLSKPPAGRTLVLQTCWPPGTTKERLLVFARPIDVGL